MLIQSLQSKEEGRKKETCDFDVCDGGHLLKMLGKDQPYICHERIYRRHSLHNQTKEEEQQHAGFLGATVETKHGLRFVSPLHPTLMCVYQSRHHRHTVQSSFCVYTAYQ